jgi:hypothetical protein
MDNPIFIYMPSDDGGSDQFFSLYQIVRVDRITEDKITLHTSDGNANTIHGKDAVAKIFTILVEHAMTLDGRPLPEVLEELPHEGPTLNKPEPE